MNETSINGRRDEQNYEWIVPIDYASNLDDFSDTFILNKSQSKLKIVVTILNVFSTSINIVFVWSQYEGGNIEQ